MKKVGPVRHNTANYGYSEIWGSTVPCTLSSCHLDPVHLFRVKQTSLNKENKNKQVLPVSRVSRTLSFPCPLLEIVFISLCFFYPLLQGCYIHTPQFPDFCVPHQVQAQDY